MLGICIIIYAEMAVPLTFKTEQTAVESCRGFTTHNLWLVAGLVDQKHHPGPSTGLGAMVTNDWCINTGLTGAVSIQNLLITFVIAC